MRLFFLLLLLSLFLLSPINSSLFSVLVQVGTINFTWASDAQLSGEEEEEEGPAPFLPLLYAPNKIPLIPPVLMEMDIYSRSCGKRTKINTTSAVVRERRESKVLRFKKEEWPWLMSLDLWDYWISLLSFLSLLLVIHPLWWKERKKGEQNDDGMERNIGLKITSVTLSNPNLLIALHSFNFGSPPFLPPPSRQLNFGPWLIWLKLE